MAKKTSETIEYEYKADTDKAVKNVDKLEKSNSKLSKSYGALGNSMNKIAPIAKTTGVAFGGVLASQAGFVLSISDNVDALAKLAASLNIDVKYLSGFGTAAALAGVNMKQLSMTFLRGEIAIGKVKTGNEAMTTTFEELGVSITDVNGKAKSNSQIMYDLLKAIDSIEDPAQRLTVSYKIFGRNALAVQKILDSGLDNFVKTGEKQSELSGITEETAATYEKLNDDITLAKKVFTDFLIVALEPVAEFLDNVLIVAMATITGQTESLTDEQIELKNKMEDLVGTIKKVAKWSVILLKVWFTYKIIAGTANLLSIAYNGLNIATGILSKSTLTLEGAMAGLTTVLLPLALAIAVAIIWIKDIIFYIQNWDAIVEGFWITFDNFVEWLKSVPKKIAEAFGKIGDILYNTFVAPFEGAIQSVQTGFNNFIGFIQSIPQRIANGLASVGDVMYNIFVAPILGAIQSVKDAFAGFGEWWNSTIGSFIGGTVDKITFWDNKAPIPQPPNNNTANTFNYNISTQNTPNFRDLLREKNLYGGKNASIFS